MLGFIRNLLGSTSTLNYKQLVREGAIIVDVRSKGEYESGHIQGSINIPVDQLRNNLPKLKEKNKPIITCCASGMRSASAKVLLVSQGFKNVHNGGGWQHLKHKI